MREALIKWVEGGCKGGPRGVRAEVDGTAEEEDPILITRPHKRMGSVYSITHGQRLRELGGEEALQRSMAGLQSQFRSFYT